MAPTRSLLAIQRFGRIDLGRDIALCECLHILSEESATFWDRRGNAANLANVVTQSAGALIGILALEAWAERHDHLFHFHG